MNLRHVGFEVNDMTKMINFYKGLGFKLFWHRREHPDGWSHDVITAKLKDDNGMVIELTKNHEAKFHLALTSKTKSRWIRDPEGNLIEIVSDRVQ